MTDLRKAARGRSCQIRLPGCDGGGETSVLAHYRLAGLNGMGMKPSDVMGAWACFSCHQIADGRDGCTDYTREQVRLAHIEGVLRTLAELMKEGLLVERDFQR